MNADLPYMGPYLVFKNRSKHRGIRLEIYRKIFIQLWHLYPKISCTFWKWKKLKKFGLFKSIGHSFYPGMSEFLQLHFRWEIDKLSNFVSYLKSSISVKSGYKFSELEGVEFEKDFPSKFYLWDAKFNPFQLTE